MADIIIQRGETNCTIESHLKDPNLHLRSCLVPEDLSDGGALGSSESLMQLLLTWSRKNKTKILKTYFSGADRSKCARFVSRAHGLAAAYFSKEVLPDMGASPDIRHALLKAAKPRIEAMHQGRLNITSRGPSIELIFIHGARLEFHGALYARAPKPHELQDRDLHGRLIREPSELNGFLRNCFDVLKVTNFFLPELNDPRQPLGYLLSETFRNTAEHAYIDSKGGSYEPNLRCVRISHSYIHREKVSEATVSAIPARNGANEYFRQISERSSKTPRSKVQFLEISIFDSGPGFSQTIAANQIKKWHTDKDAVAECFKKHQSIKKNAVAGLGLHRIITAVHTLGGFLRLRTSTTEAFFAATKDFNPDMDPKSFVHGELSPAEGSVVTIGIPIRY